VREYETTFIVQPEISEEGVQALCERLDAILAKNDATRLLYDDLGRRRLAYEIQNFQKGRYLTLIYLDDGRVVPEIERTLRLDDSVLRFLTVQANDGVEDIEARKAEAAELERVRAEKAAARAAREAEEAERAAREAEEMAAARDGGLPDAGAEDEEEGEADENGRPELGEADENGKPEFGEADENGTPELGEDD
jgi:small subunit ribosomal protein S6